MFSSEIFKNTYFYRTHPVAASVHQRNLQAWLKFTKLSFFPNINELSIYT